MSKSFQPWCSMSCCLLLGNWVSSFITVMSDSSPVERVIVGNLPVSLYCLSLRASWYMRTKWKLTAAFLCVPVDARLSISLSSLSVG